MHELAWLTLPCLAIQLISAAKNLEPEYIYLNIRLRLEQQRLYNWSSEVGLLRYLEGDEDVPDDGLMRLSRNTVLDTLRQIQVLVQDFIKCREQFGGLVADDGDCELETLDEHAGDGLPDHFFDRMRFRKKSRDPTPLLRALPKRLKWVTFFKDKYEKLINQLRELNDVLIDLVDSDARVAIGRSTRDTITTMLHLHSKIDNLCQLVKALSPNSASDSSTPFVPGVQQTSTLDTQQRHELAALAYFKAINTLIHKDTPSSLEKPVFEGTRLRQLILARSEFHLLSTFGHDGDQCEAEYKPPGSIKRRVWIEWREHDQITGVEAGGTMDHSSRVDKLVALLSDPRKPDLLRVPRCIGYLNDAKNSGEGRRRGRLGFVFEMPSPTAGVPVSLRQLLKIRTKPLLTERIALAKALCNCLVSLHSVNWLHKGLRSHSIVFFSDNDNGIDYSCPFLSGFGYARPAFRGDMTELPSQNPEHDMYRHPRMHGLGPWEGRQGFKWTFDIYSLGIVLVEIANWMRIDELLELGDPKKLDDPTLAAIQRRLLNEKVHMENVGSNAGCRFRDATLSCLRGATAFGLGAFDDETNEHVAARLSKGFYLRVLRPLEEIQT